MDADYINQNFHHIAKWKQDVFKWNGLVGSRFNVDAIKRHLVGYSDYKGASAKLLASEIRLEGKLIACDILLANSPCLYGHIRSHRFP